MCTNLEHLIWWRHWHSDFSWGITWEMWEHCWTHIQQNETCGFCDLRQSLNSIFEGLWESLPSAHPCDIQPASIIIYYSSMQAATTDAGLLENSNINERDPELTTIHPKLDIEFKYVNGKNLLVNLRCHIDINKMQSECIYLPCHNDLIQLCFHSCTSSLVGIRTWLKIYQTWNYL